MSGVLRPTRYAHSEGHTDVCYSKDGRLLVTCGEDGDVRVFQGLDDDDCLTHSVGDQATAVGYKFPQLVVASDSNCVQLFDPDDGAPGQVVTRFTACPTCIHVSGHLIAAGASDMVVRVHDSIECRDTLLEGHTAPVLSVALDPKGEYVASSSCDGSVRVWFITTGLAVKTMPDVLPKSNQFWASKSLARMCFSKTGSHLMVPMADKVAVLARDTWKKEREFATPDSDATVSIVALSACGTLVATSTNQGSISVFEYSSGELMFSVRHPKRLAITGLVWHPTLATEMAFVDCHGQLGALVNITTKSSGKASAVVEMKQQTKSAASDIDNGDAPFPPLDVDADVDLDTMLNDINDKLMTTADNDGLQDNNIDDDEDDDNNVSLAKIKSQMGFADDEHGTYLGVPKGDEDAAVPQAPSPTPTAAAPPPSGPRLPEIQRCFTPSMTPEHHTQRYMLWNNIGIVKQYSLEEDCSIGVEFHDSSLHHTIHLANGGQQSYTIAALSDQALVLGAEAASDAPSRVSVQLLSGVTGQDWSVELPDGEDITALAASSEIVCIASDSRQVHVLSIGGATIDVLTVPGPLVCLSAHGDTVLALYHAGIGAAGDQQIHYLLVSTMSSASNTKKGQGSMPVALSPQSYVAWAGFSDEGTPVVTDSEGVVRMAHPRHPAGVWAVILMSKELTKGRSDNHFILGVTESEARVRSILCRGARFPPVMPPPYVSLLDFKVPVLDGSSEKGELEATAVRSELQLATLNTLRHTRDVSAPVQDAELLLQTTLIKLFALSCRSGREVRALDMCRLMTDRTLQSALKYAAKMGRETLAEHIGDALQRKKDERDEQMWQGLPSLSDSNCVVTTPNTSYANLSLEPLARPSPQHSSTAQHSTPEQAATATQEVNSDDDGGDDTQDNDDTNQNSASSNPLLEAKRHEQRSALSMDDSALAPTKVNPFRRATPSDASKKGFKVLDDYKPKVDAPILRPVLKKKSKASRGLTKTPSLHQPSIKFKAAGAATAATGKENHTNNTTASSAPSDEQPKNKDAGAAVLFRDSSMYKSSIAMHLWWADNEALVRGGSDSQDVKTLVASAALKFKDIPDTDKMRYKKLASSNNSAGSVTKTAATAACVTTTTAVAADDTSTNKRKRDNCDTNTSTTDGGTAMMEDDTAKKLKQGSGVSKLAAFAFKKD